MKIVLIGFMGSGKTTISRLLASSLNVEAIEMDALALAASRRDSIADIFAIDGETRFRMLEAATARSLARLREGVISTGGGVVLNPSNMVYLCEGAHLVVYLKATFDTLLQRLEGDTQRPLLADLEKAAQLFATRATLYERYAGLIIDTDELTPEQIAMKILAAHAKQ